MGQSYLSVTQIAERTGLARNTVKVYAQLGHLPPPDATIGRVKGWLSETIDVWWMQRKGNGQSVRANGHDAEPAKTKAMTANRVFVSAKDGRVTVASLGE